MIDEDLLDETIVMGVDEYAKVAALSKKTAKKPHTPPEILGGEEIFAISPAEQRKATEVDNPRDILIDLDDTYKTNHDKPNKLYKPERKSFFQRLRSPHTLYLSILGMLGIAFIWFYLSVYLPSAGKAFIIGVFTL